MPEFSANPTDIRTSAELFAKALDADDFQTAIAIVAPDCQYFIRDKMLEGPAAIIDSYREASEKARRIFDLVEYGSEIVEACDQCVAVKFSDRLEIHGHKHSYNSQQVLTFGPDGRIIRIEHQEIPGEREALTAFMDLRGVERL